MIKPISKHPDFLYPTGDGQTRDEIFLIEFDDIIQSSVEAIFYGLTMLPEYAERFPGLMEFDAIKPYEFYYGSALLDPVQFLQSLYVKPGEMPEEELREIMAKCHAIDTFALRTRLMVFYALTDLAEHNFVKRIDFVNERGLEEFEMRALQREFYPYHQKINFFEGSVPAIMKDHAEYTTVFMRNVFQLLDMLKSPAEYHLEKTALFLRNSLQNVELIPNTTGDTETQYTYHELFNEEIVELAKDKPFQVGRFTSTVFNPPGDANV